MAGIDCTYTKSWEEYQDLIKWAKDKVFVCFHGISYYITKGPQTEPLVSE